jgi:hypothetical protein
MAGARINFLGFMKDGAKIIAQNKTQDQFKIRCACGEEFTRNREYVRRSRAPRHQMQCYECSCKARARGAEATAAKRNRFKGQFAPGKVA